MLISCSFTFILRSLNQLSLNLSKIVWILAIYKHIYWLIYELLNCTFWVCCLICFSRCKKAHWTEVWRLCCAVRHEALAVHCYKWQLTPQSSSWIQRGDQDLLPRGDFFHGANKDEGNCWGIPWKSRFSIKHNACICYNGAEKPSPLLLYV